MSMDSEHEVNYANTEAVQIVSYPGNPTGVPSLNSFLAERIRSSVLKGAVSLQAGPLAVEFLSGRRRYVCRAFALESGSPWPAALIFERSDRRSFIAQMASRFALSRRERHVLEALVTGMTNKEIATRMDISANTVKVYLRSIMTKMSVSTRGGIVARTLGLIGTAGSSPVPLDSAQPERKGLQMARLSRTTLVLPKTKDRGSEGT